MSFFLVLVLVVASVHVYLWWRLVRDTRLPRAVEPAATFVLVALFLAIPGTLVLWRSHSHSAPALVLCLGFGWLGVMFYMLTLLGSLDLSRGLFRLGAWLWPRRSQAAQAPEQAQAPQPAAQARLDAAEHTDGQTRRVFVARALAGTAVAASGGIAAFGVRSAFWDITMPEVAVRLPRLPKALDGYTIALMTDIHIGPLLHGRFLRHLAEQVNSARPDLIAICGDLVDGSVEQIGVHVAELRRMRARQGVCFVTGNHEYYSGAAPWCDFLTQLGVRVLMNERIALGDAAVSGAQFDLVGVPDYRAGTAGGLAPDARAATRGRDEQRELVVLAHQPIQISDAARVGAGLQLSGHTHGGQLFPFGALVAAFAQPYLAGLHRHEATETQIYVSRGTGFWGPPMRVLAPAEITLLRLHSA